MPWCVSVYVSVCEWEGDRQRLSYLECVKYLESEILYLWSNLWNWSQCLYIFYYTYISVLLYIYVYVYISSLPVSILLFSSASPILHMWYCPIWSHYWPWASVHHFQSFFSILFSLNRISSISSSLLIVLPQCWISS